MDVWVRRLVDLVGWEPLGLDIEWADIERRVGVTFPADYKELCEVFGEGEFDTWLWIFSSGGGSMHFLPDNLKRLRGDAAFHARYFLPYTVFDGTSGLIPWASTEQGDNLYWDVQGPSGWEIIAAADEKPWHRLRMSTAEAVYRMLTESDFPIGVADDISEHVYVPGLDLT